MKYHTNSLDCRVARIERLIKKLHGHRAGLIKQYIKGCKAGGALDFDLRRRLGLLLRTLPLNGNIQYKYNIMSIIGSCG